MKEYIIVNESLTNINLSFFIYCRRCGHVLQIEDNFSLLYNPYFINKKVKKFYCNSCNINYYFVIYYEENIWMFFLQELPILSLSKIKEGYYFENIMETIKKFIELYNNYEKVDMKYLI